MALLGIFSEHIVLERNEMKTLGGGMETTKEPDNYVRVVGQ